MGLLKTLVPEDWCIFQVAVNSLTLTMVNNMEVLLCSQQYQAIRNFSLHWISSSISSPLPPATSHNCFLGELPVSGTGTFSVTAAVSLCLELHEPDELLAFGSELNQKILLYVRTTITLVYFTHSNVFSLSLFLPTPTCL